MKVQRLNEEMFAPMEQNEMMMILGGSSSRVKDTLIEQTDNGQGGDVHIKTIKSRD